MNSLELYNARVSFFNGSPNWETEYTIQYNQRTIFYISKDQGFVVAVDRYGIRYGIGEIYINFTPYLFERFFNELPKELRSEFAFNLDLFTK